MQNQNLLQKATEFDSIIQKRHLIGNIIIPTTVLPPFGENDFSTGNHENCAIWTGLYIVAKSLEYAVTGLQKARQTAMMCIQGLNMLQEITNCDESGQRISPKLSGIIARGYKKRSKPTDDEKFFWIKNEEGKKEYENIKKRRDSFRGYRRKDEWRQAGDYRWLGDASKSQVFGVMFGYFMYTLFCEPDPVEKESISNHACAIVDKIIGNDGAIVDRDGKPTQFGKYRKKFSAGFGGLGPSLLLSHLKLAEFLSGDKKYTDEFNRLVNEKKYDRTLALNRINPPVVRKWHTNFGSDDNLALLNLLMLNMLNPNQKTKKLIKEGVRKRFFTIGDCDNSLFTYIYHSITGKGGNFLSVAEDALSRFPIKKTVPLVTLKRHYRGGSVKSKLLWTKSALFGKFKPIQDRPVDEYAWRVNPYRDDEWCGGKEGTMEFTGVDFLLAYWLGRWLEAL